MVAAIVGPPAPVEVALGSVNGVTGTILSPACTFAGIAGPETADPAVRLAAFLDEFPGRSQLTSICNADLSGALSQIGTSAKKLLVDPCLPRRAEPRGQIAGCRPSARVRGRRHPRLVTHGANDPARVRPRHRHRLLLHQCRSGRVPVGAGEPARSHPPPECTGGRHVDPCSLPARGLRTTKSRLSQVRRQSPVRLDRTHCVARDCVGIRVLGPVR